MDIPTTRIDGLVLSDDLLQERLIKAGFGRVTHTSDGLTVFEPVGCMVAMVDGTFVLEPDSPSGIAALQKIAAGSANVVVALPHDPNHAFDLKNPAVRAPTSGVVSVDATAA